MKTLESPGGDSAFWVFFPWSHGYSGLGFTKFYLCSLSHGLLPPLLIRISKILMFILMTLASSGESLFPSNTICGSEFKTIHHNFNDHTI